MHPSKAVLPSDKAMSARHIANRMKNVKAKGPALYKQSVMYNKAHAKEHLKAAKDAAKRLKKASKLTPEKAQGMSLADLEKKLS